MEREEGEEVLLSLALERGRRKEEEKRGYRKRGGVFSTTAPNFEDEEFTLYQRKEHEKEEGRVGESEEEELPFPYNRKVESPSFIIKTAPDNKHRCDDHLEDILVAAMEERNLFWGSIKTYFSCLRSPKGEEPPRVRDEVYHA